MVEFNLNYRMGVKLTDLGVKILRERHEELQRRVPTIGDFKEPKVDADGYYTDQAWSIMQVFGPYIGMARPQPFDINVRLYPIDRNRESAPAAGAPKNTVDGR